MKYEDSDYEASSGSWLLTFILGGLIGAAVALLLAPKSGSQTREQIKDMAQEAKEKAEGYYGQARNKMSDAMQKSSELFQKKKSEAEPAVSEEENV
jgi:gas vesicle protein